jgi:hypothetical protein
MNLQDKIVGKLKQLRKKQGKKKKKKGTNE